MMKSFPENKEFRTGFRLVAWLLVLTVPISSWIAWDIYHDPHRLMYEDLPALVSLIGGFNGMCVLIGLGIGFQRIRLDLAAQKIHYANIGTFHLWRDLDVRHIQAVHFESAAHRSHAMVDALCLVVQSPEAGGFQRVVRLIDSSLSPWSGGPSPMFSEIVDFIKALKPLAGGTGHIGAR